MNTLATLLVLFLAFVHESVGYSYSISNAAQFMEFASDVNSGKKYAGDTVYLTNDIDLSAYSSNYAPVGLGYGVWFLGTFDGQGHTFSGLKYNTTKYDNVGIFGDIGGTTIKNFVVDDTCSFNVPHEQKFCYMYGVGGITGGVLTAIGDITLTNLVNMATVSGGYWTGGIVGSGSATGNGVITISNSVNYGTITGIDCNDGLARTGGIAGSLFTQGRVTKTVTISNCANYGYLINPYMRVNAGEFGGIIGQIDYVILVKNNINLGMMEAGGPYTWDTGCVIGSTSGTTTAPGTIRNNYWMSGNLVEKGIGRIELSEYLTITQNVDFNSDYTLSTDVTVGSYSGKSLIDALNAEDPRNPKWSLVSFVMNGGKFTGHSYTTVPVFDGRFPSPVKDGATFKGWYLDSAFTEKYVPGHSLEKLILYAKW